MLSPVGPSVLKPVGHMCASSLSHSTSLLTIFVMYCRMSVYNKINLIIDSLQLALLFFTAITDTLLAPVVVRQAPSAICSDDVFWVVSSI